MMTSREKKLLRRDPRYMIYFEEKRKEFMQRNAQMMEKQTRFEALALTAGWLLADGGIIAFLIMMLVGRPIDALTAAACVGLGGSIVEFQTGTFKAARQAHEYAMARVKEDLERESNT